MRRIAAVAALALVAGLAGCSGGAQSSGAAATPTRSAVALTEGVIYGRLAVEADFGENTVHGNTTKGGPCISPDGYQDISDGTGITITNADGKIVGSTTLTAKGLTPAGGSMKMMDTHCEFDFIVDHVPNDSDFYTIQIGRRGSMTFSADEVFSNVTMTLGNVPGDDQ